MTKKIKNNETPPKLTNQQFNTMMGIGTGLLFFDKDKKVVVPNFIKWYNKNK